MGQPPKHREKVTIYLPPDERDQLKARAAEAGVSLSDMLSAIVTRSNVRARESRRKSTPE